LQELQELQEFQGFQALQEHLLLLVLRFLQGYRASLYILIGNRNTFVQIENYKRNVKKKENNMKLITWRNR
jgi:hypothetical protein